MAFIDDQLVEFKRLIENAIRTNGSAGKKSIICSSSLINLIHEAVKFELINQGIKPNNIFPHLGRKSPEIKLSGFLKQKKQDVCVMPSNIQESPLIIDWGPMSNEQRMDPYGFEYSTNSIVINIRSQMSSLGKNSDTLFERTYAEPLNLHIKYPDIVLGEVYLIPLYEYDDSAVARREVAFSNRQTKVEKYINFFNAINNRNRGGNDYQYERCALLIVDFNNATPILYNNSRELIEAGIISANFNIEYETLSFRNFARDIIRIYGERFDINNIISS